ncbi:MAG: nuclear transport factor 2 family protein [Candidatus Nitricoxidivorans perseverans]|uniref:Nuclear transport factor 2 family protein n=1 Tax=Candidatus Nitricoxidivorans perseverans TaxID=2975601 RepID=A0AA49FNR3_9PROT|nr:MAG: nuclear transport factor 2 family protein [Candidatus Nitricoxidivorans perseverans]
MTQRPIFATPQDAETAFYDALERADLEAMMAVWAEDEEIVCVHPGGPRLTGYAAVREAWRRVFQSGRRLQVSVSHQTHVQGPFSAVYSVLEQVTMAEGGVVRAPVIATNVYVRGPMGWRMIVHHASPAPSNMPIESPKVLH